CRRTQDAEPRSHGGPPDSGRPAGGYVGKILGPLRASKPLPNFPASAWTHAAIAPKLRGRSTMPSAQLVLEDGRAFTGQRFGALSDAEGEVVFNTSMTGYQEILGDPSYAGQIVVMTYPMIGNYGIAPEDFESRK